MRRWLLLPLAAAVAMAQPRALTFHSAVDDTDQPYALYLPKTLDPARKYPLVVSLHEAGSNHRLNLRRVFGKGARGYETAAEAGQFFPPLPDVDFIVACPFARGSLGYEGIGEQEVYDVMAEVKRRFPVDEDRVYLTGLAMGGSGALRLGLTRPDLWAAIAAVCPDDVPALDELAGNALNLPVHLFHGDQDPVTPVEVSRRWQKRFLDVGVRAEYVEYPAVRHNAWDFAYKDAAIFNWFARFRRARLPERVRFASRQYRYNAAYWVRLDELTPGTPATIDARFTGKNRIEAATRNLEGFTLAPAGHAQYSGALPLAVTIDGTALRLKAGAAARFHKGPQGWAAGPAAVQAGKRPGAEGPAAEAIAARHIYVYGTADAPGDDELKRRREVASRAATWSTASARMQLLLAVKSDRQVDAGDMQNANLILFGNRETNAVIARMAAQLPLALEPGAADWSLTFVAPVGGRYVVVNSGLPWWTGASGQAPFRVLERFGDFMVFKGSLENVVAEGVFDRQWRMPAVAAEKLRAAGTVEVK